MLTLLRIRNYAIIDDLEIEFFSGFSVMTGETGAGKSILVDALGLALGDRADATAVRSGTERAEISLVFEIDARHPARVWLSERGLDDEDLCCLRRTVPVDGSSRAFVNNQPVTLKDLRALGELLVDIHGQHEHQSLLAPRVQRSLLDSSAGLLDLAERVAAAHAQWQEAVEELERRSDRSAEREAELELLRFQLADIDALELASGEVSGLRIESSRLKNVDQLQQAIAQAADALYDSESGSAYGMAARARTALEAAVVHDPELAPLLERLTTAEVELRELGNDLSHRLHRLDADPARLDDIEARLARIQQIARRHRIPEDDVADLAARLRERLADLDAGAESLAALETRVRTTAGDYASLGAQLSAARVPAAKALSDAVTARLHELGLPAAEFRVLVQPRPEARRDSTGFDQIDFMVSLNPGQAPGPIQRIASGGELSRIGLALAVVATDAAPIPTLVFDEVDAGIGGAVAEVVGRRLREIASRHQVLCVTHLPQVASQGMHHYRIAKLTDGKTSRTQVRLLDAEQRVDELSRMLGGLEITAATRAHAEEMIRQAAEA